MPYVAHYYPASDAGRFFRVGSTIEIAGPLFTTYADAAAQLSQELEDIDAHSLPVSPYILQVEQQRNGFRIVEAFDAEVGSAGRARNPRREGARMTPIGELIGDRVQMYEPRGIEVGPRQQEYEPTEAADVFGGFMADAAPRGVSARRIAHAFHTGITPPKVLEERADQRDAKEKAIEKVARQVDKDVQTLGVEGAIEKSEEKLAAIVEAVESGQITRQEAAVPIAVETKKQEILAILNRFCPTIGEEGTEAIYEVVKATLGGDPDAAEASRVILEKVGKRVTGRPVKVVTGEPKPKGKKAAAQIAGGVAPFNGDVTAFVKANGHYFTGMPTGLVGKVIDNALGLSPFPVDHPIAQLRQVSEAAYRLLEDAGVLEGGASAGLGQIVPFPTAAAPLADVVAEQVAELPRAEREAVIEEVAEAAAEAAAVAPSASDYGLEEVRAILRKLRVLSNKRNSNTKDRNTWFDLSKKLADKQSAVNIPAADRIASGKYDARFSWQSNLDFREKALYAQGQTPWWRQPAEEWAEVAEVAEAQPLADTDDRIPEDAFDEAVRIVALPFREAERALESSRFTGDQLFDALEDQNYHSECMVLNALRVPMRLMRPNLWKEAKAIVEGHRKAGELTPALQERRNALSAKIYKYLTQQIEPIVAVEAPAPMPTSTPAFGPRRFSVEADGIDAVLIPNTMLPTSAGYLQNEIVYGSIRPDWGVGVYRRNTVFMDDPTAWKHYLLPDKTFKNIKEWASQYYWPDSVAAEVQPLAEVVAEQVAELPRAEREAVIEEVAEAPVSRPASTRIKLESLGGSYENIPPLDEGAYNRRVEGADYKLDQLTEEVRQMSLEPRGVSMTVMGKAEKLKRLLQEARRLSRKPLKGIEVLDELESGLIALNKEINDETIKNEMAAAAERKRAKEIAEASRSSAPAPVAARENTLSHMTDGITGVEVPWYRVPLGNDAFQYALGVVQSGDIDAIYRRSASQRGTYGGWRLETSASKLIPESTASAPVVPLVPAVLDRNRRAARIEGFVSGTDGIDGISVPQEFLPPGINLSKMRVAYGYTRWKGLGVYTQFKPFKYGDEWDFLPLPPDKLAPIAKWAEQYFQPLMPISAPVESAPVAAVEPDEADVEFSQFNEPQVAPSRSRRPSAEPRAARTSRIPRAGQPGLSWATPQVIAADAPSDWAPAPAIVSAAAAAATAVDDDDAAETARATQAAAELAVENQKAFAMIQKMFGL